jgi:hypothetical protein
MRLNEIYISQSIGYIFLPWSRNLNRENRGKRRTWVQKRKTERKKEEKNTESKNDTRDRRASTVWMFYPNKS